MAKRGGSVGCPSCGKRLVAHVIREPSDMWKLCGHIDDCPWRTCMECELTMGWTPSGTYRVVATRSPSKVWEGAISPESQPPLR